MYMLPENSVMPAGGGRCTLPCRWLHCIAQGPEAPALLWQCIRRCPTCQEAPSCRKRTAIRQPGSGCQSSRMIQLVLRRNLPELH
jgi:hypothetical protein